MRYAYERNRTYNSWTQDIAFLIEQAYESGATAIEITHPEGLRITIEWNLGTDEPEAVS